jgi:DNA-binding CsgD family transcriptional regulator
MLLIIRADVEIGRGDFDAARAHLDAAPATLRKDRGLGLYDAYLAELALWERRWADADQAVHDGLTRARTRSAAQIRVQLCAKGLRAQAELAALARARRDGDAVRDRLTRARKLLTTARRAAAEAGAITPNAAGWRALAEAEYQRARGVARPELWSNAANTWEQLERPPLAAYCRWRQAEALVAAGDRDAAARAAGDALATARRLGARWLASEIDGLAARARLRLGDELAAATAADRDGGADEREPDPFGLTPRERQVLALLAAGATNREIGAALYMAEKTASVHVSRILAKLDVRSRTEAAAVAHRHGLAA